MESDIPATSGPLNLVESNYDDLFDPIETAKLSEVLVSPAAQQQHADGEPSQVPEEHPSAIQGEPEPLPIPQVNYAPIDQDVSAGCSQIQGELPSPTADSSDIQHISSTAAADHLMPRHLDEDEDEDEDEDDHGAEDEDVDDDEDDHGVDEPLEEDMDNNEDVYPELPNIFNKNLH
ncbi:hypothetical protein Lser_V15G09808 [Lactuca serriola]